MTRTRARSLAGLALASTLLLTGCGSVPGFNPGVASRVGDETVTTNDVDEVTESYCGAAEAQLTDGQVLPNSYLRGDHAEFELLEETADLRELLAAEYPVLQRNLADLQSATLAGGGSQAAAESSRALDAVLLKLDAIKSNMQDIEDFNEIIDLVRGLLDDQEKVLSETEQEQRKRILELLR